MTNANMGEIRPVLAMLADLGVSLPETTRKAHDAIAVLEDETRFPQGIPDGLASMTPEQLLAEVDRVTFARDLGEARRNTRGHFSLVLAGTIVDDLTEHTDDILDQLRPAFDKAARGVVAAHKAGVRADHGADDILKLDAKAVGLWHQMSAAVVTLDGIADARLRLARAIGAAPAADQESGAFCSAAGAWLRTRHHNRWLALVDHGLRLNTAAETREACRRPRPDAPMAPSNEFRDTSPAPSAWIRV